MGGVSVRTSYTSGGLCAISLSAYSSVENMGKSELRRAYTSKGSFILSPYPKSTVENGSLQIILRNNLISKLEIVSSLNLFNLARLTYHYNYVNCLEKYNPKVYIGTFQTVALDWNADLQAGQKNGLPDLQNGVEKSGSCFSFSILPLLN